MVSRARRVTGNTRNSAEQPDSQEWPVTVLPPPPRGDAAGKQGDVVISNVQRRRIYPVQQTGGSCLEASLLSLLSQFENKK